MTGQPIPTPSPRNSTDLRNRISYQFHRYAGYLRYKIRYYFYRVVYGIQFRFDKHIIVAGFPNARNFGDALNMFLIGYLSGKKVLPSRYIKKKNAPIYAVIGSILHWADDRAIVWGSGLISDQVKAPQGLDIKAVRGPLTRDLLKAQGLDCPQVYGDPALLMPLIYRPDIAPVYDYGVLPHYSDKEHPALKDLDRLGSAILLDIQTGANGLPLIDQILSCKVLVTSSLHGMILAHAYGVPCVWVKFGDIRGGTYKFRDYLMSVGKNDIQQLEIKEKIDEDELLENIDDSPIAWDPSALIESCPFIQEKIRVQLLSKVIHE